MLSYIFLLILINPTWQWNEKLEEAVKKKYGPGVTYHHAASFGELELKKLQIIKHLAHWGKHWMIQFNMRIDGDNGLQSRDLLNHLSLEVDKENYGSLDVMNASRTEPHPWSRVPEFLIDSDTLLVANTRMPDPISHWAADSPIHGLWYAVTVCQRPITKPQVKSFIFQIRNHFDNLFFRETKTPHLYLRSRRLEMLQGFRRDSHWTSSMKFRLSSNHFQRLMRCLKT